MEWLSSFLDGELRKRSADVAGEAGGLSSDRMAKGMAERDVADVVSRILLKEPVGMGRNVESDSTATRKLIACPPQLEQIPRLADTFSTTSPRAEPNTNVGGFNSVHNDTQDLTGDFNFELGYLSDEESDDNEDGLPQSNSVDDAGMEERSDVEPRSSGASTAVQQEPLNRSLSARREDRIHLLNQARLSTQVSRRVYDALGQWPGLTMSGGRKFDSSDVVNRALKKVAPVNVQDSDCCENGCLAYTGQYEDWDENQACGICNEPRRKSGPFKFTYISPFNRLRALFENPVLRKKLDYRRDRTVTEGEMDDVFDGEHYKTLLGRNVSWRGSQDSPEHQYFDQATDIALGFSTDGIPLHNRTGLDAWPLVLTVYSLPPGMRYKQEFQLCCGLVPGTKHDKEGKIDFDNFLQPLLEDLRILATRGIQAHQYNTNTGTLQPFTLRGHLLTVSGDMPAIFKLMCFKGINAIYPCRFCEMLAVKNVTAARCPYYMTTLTPEASAFADYGNLLLRNDSAIKSKANEIEHAPNKTAREYCRSHPGSMEKYVESRIVLPFQAYLA